VSDLPPHLRPFVLDPAPVTPERDGNLDLYVPPGDGPFPGVVLVHGGPVPPERRPTPRDWASFRGYGALLAAEGIVAGVVDHRYHVVDGPAGPEVDAPTAAADVAAAIGKVRADGRVDGERIAVWAFSGGGLLSADWIRERPGWLRAVFLTYPMLGSVFEGLRLDPRFDPVAAVTAAGAGAPPIVLTRVGREREVIADTVAAFVAAAGAAQARLEIVDVPDGHHAFDMVDHTDQSREAVTGAVARLAALLRGPTRQGVAAS